ncbi:MAG: phytoene/squalene synthase family protein [Planctomycetota bacterium]|jgi:phytoene synthase
MSDPLADSYAFCRRFARRTAKNFYYSFLGLPADRFDAMCILYSYMRICDDIGDDERVPAETRMAGLDVWESEVLAALTASSVADQNAATPLPASGHLLPRGEKENTGSLSPLGKGSGRGALDLSTADQSETIEPGDAVDLESLITGRRVLPALTQMVEDFEIPHEYFFEVLAGVRADLVADRHCTDRNSDDLQCSFASFDELAEYCYRVAGVVGRCCIHIWGFNDQRALDLAVDCGLAFQLTNILRDLAEDADNGRVYLPADELQQFDYSPQDIVRRTRGERFQRLMAFQVERAATYYDRANELFDCLDPVGQPILSAMIRIYGGLLTEIEKRRFDVYSCRVSMPTWRKLLIAADAILRRRRVPQRPVQRSESETY